MEGQLDFISFPRGVVSCSCYGDDGRGLTENVCSFFFFFRMMDMDHKSGLLFFLII